MKVLIINGSPRLQKSNTLRLTEAFLRGMGRESPITPFSIDVYAHRIEPCRGCFVCWNKTPGRCCIQDDMEQFLSAFVSAEAVLWSFPLYYHGMPSQVKALIDRLLPLNEPFIEEDEAGNARHPGRYELQKQRHVLISTCGFYSVQHNYEPLEHLWKSLFGPSLTTIFCPEGELFSVPELRRYTDPYIQLVEEAGAEYARKGVLSEEMERRLQQLLLPKETFIQLANASWGLPYPGPARREESPSSTFSVFPEQQKGGVPFLVKEERPTPENRDAAGDSFPREEKEDVSASTAAFFRDDARKAPAEDESFFFVRQMAALYNPAELEGKEALLEIYFTDKDLSYFFYLGKEKCQVFPSSQKEQLGTALSTLPHTRIETSYSVWKDIAAGKIDGTRALMEGKYRVLGNFDLMLKMGNLFAGPGVVHTSSLGSVAEPSLKKEPQGRKKTNLALLIFPWFPLWFVAPFSRDGALYGLLGSIAALQVAGLWWHPTPYEGLTVMGLVGAVVGLLLQVPSAVVVSFSYLFLAGSWLCSCCLPIPLTAHYSKDGYGGDAILGNPLFIRTNRIITAVWAGVYGLMALISYLIMQSPLPWLVGPMNSFLPVVGGLWTNWFQRWYPQHIARGR